MQEIQEVVGAIAAKRRAVPADNSMLVALSGIDGSGKGYITQQVVRAFQDQGVRAISLNVDGWLNLPARRFNKDQPAEHFYQHALRFDGMFAQLVLPLKRQRGVSVEMDFAEETAH